MQVQQPFDPTSYYAQFYRSAADSDGRISPFHSAGISTKYNGNVSMLSPQASQPSQEVCLYYKLLSLFTFSYSLAFCLILRVYNFSNSEIINTFYHPSGIKHHKVLTNPS